MSLLLRRSIPRVQDLSQLRTLKLQAKSDVSAERFSREGFGQVIAGAEPDLQDDSPGEGVYALIQTNGCRRRIWNKVYGNEPVGMCISPQYLYAQLIQA
jgi:hypothetical protein